MMKLMQAENIKEILQLQFCREINNSLNMISIEIPAVQKIHCSCIF